MFNNMRKHIQPIVLVLGILLILLPVVAQVPEQIAKSLARGKAVYEDSGCTACHGLQGRGDGPANMALRPKAPDFALGFKSGDRFIDIYNVIKKGKPGTAKVAYEEVLSDYDIASVTAYVLELRNKPLVDTDNNPITPAKKPDDIPPVETDDSQAADETLE